MSDQNNFPNISVVIATLGGECLFKTIEQLNRGSVVPFEILICIPEADAYKVKEHSFTNVKVISTPARGQVFQRAIGFREAKSDFVLQLDDDVIVNNECLYYLITSIESLDKKSAISPLFYDLKNDNTSSPLINRYFFQNVVNPRTLTRKFLNALIHGKKSFEGGVVTSAGMNIQFDPTDKIKSFYQVEWLPGGCVLHRKENLIEFNFFPFSGKAFCEDLIHSAYLCKEGIKLYICRLAKCEISFEEEKFMRLSAKAIIKNVCQEFRARLLFVRLSKKSVPRLFLWYSFLYYKLPIRGLLRIFRN